MHLNKKIKKALFSTAFTLICVTSLSAYSINLTVNDAELEFPLEGVKVSVKNSADISAEFLADTILVLSSSTEKVEE